MVREGAGRLELSATLASLHLTVWVMLEHQYLDHKSVSSYNPIDREEISPMHRFQ